MRVHAESTPQIRNIRTTIDIQHTTTPPGVEALADKSLIGCLKLLVALQRDKRLRAMCTDPRLRHVRAYMHFPHTHTIDFVKHKTPHTRAQEDDSPFQLRMRFGLHAGWAIEGAVGSAHKARIYVCVS